MSKNTHTGVGVDRRPVSKKNGKKRQNEVIAVLETLKSAQGKK